MNPSRKRLLAHAALLTLVLLLSGVAVGRPGRYSADEGAALITGRSLADGRGWITPHPLPTVDRTGAEYPIVSSERGEKGTSAYVKHPVFAVIVAAGEWLAPGWGPMLAAVLGTVAAALLAACLARRLDPRTEVAALWIVGVASPLFVDSYLVMAHTLAAAAAVGAAFLADRARQASRRHLPVLLLGTAGAVTLTTMLRTEGLFLGLGLAVGLAVVSPPGTRPRQRHLAVAFAALAGVTAARVLDRVLLRAIVGAPQPDLGQVVDVSGGVGFARGRLDALSLTLARPSYGGGTGALLLVLAVGLLVAAVYLYLTRSEGLLVAAWLVVAAGSVVAVRALAIAPDGVPGLLVAFPLGWVGVVAARRGWRAGGLMRLLLVTAAAFAVGVAATQYAVGGGVEWGGRYFALAIPLLAPLAAAGLIAVGDRLDRPAARLAGLGTLLLVLGLALLGGRELHHTNAEANRFYAQLHTRTVAAGLGRRPVVVTSELLLPRLAGTDLDDQRWLLADPTAPRHLVARLRRAGIEKFALVSGDPRRDRPLVAGATVVWSTVIEGWQVTIYRT